MKMKMILIDLFTIAQTLMLSSNRMIQLEDIQKIGVLHKILDQS